MENFNKTEKNMEIIIKTETQVIKIENPDTECDSNETFVKTERNTEIRIKSEISPNIKSETNKDNDLETVFVKTETNLEIIKSGIITQSSTVQINENRFQCKFCAQSFSEIIHLRQHEIIFHTSGDGEQFQRQVGGQNEKPFKCRSCNNKFASKTALRNHSRFNKRCSSFNTFKRRLHNNRGNASMPNLHDHSHLATTILTVAATIVAVVAMNIYTEESQDYLNSGQWAYTDVTYDNYIK